MTFTKRCDDKTKEREGVLQSKSAEVRKIVKFFEDDEAKPARMNLRITEKCNLDCLFCDKGLHYNESAADELSERRLHEIVEQASEMGINYVNIDGSGEPFIRKTCTLSVMEKIKEFDMKGHIVTNGTLLNYNDIKTIVDMGWERIQVSIDGPDTKIHDYLRQRSGTFKKTLEFLQKLQREKKERNKNKPILNISAVVSKINYKKIPELVKLASSLNVGELNLQPLHKRTPYAWNLKLKETDRKKLQNILERAEKRGYKHNVKINIGQEEKDMLIDSFNLGEIKTDKYNEDNELVSIPCHMPLINVSVKVNGSVGPSEQLDFQEENIKERDLDEIWQSDLFNEIRTFIKDGNLPEPCENCCGIQVLETEELRKILEKIKESGS